MPTINEKLYYVYIMTNKTNSVLYTGVTSDLKGRVWQHKEKLVKSFTKSYNINKLVYFEATNDVVSAITREKQIKAGSRKKKMELIDAMNNKWQDLYDTL